MDSGVYANGSKNCRNRPKGSCTFELSLGDMKVPHPDRFWKGGHTRAFGFHSHTSVLRIALP